ncbi:DHA2 family efflux MFS transporter permease subunit [Sphingobium estronivorans]|uniref:DHA2 family efflux MFS transporter permease subunit n=1 Tax=Sphingobium estronivorans TaxID=1577690 RepID=UPI00123854A6|nr:DHA2 family efflux MFS transporter permease subunit [Sphingobium estronivorans]
MSRPAETFSLLAPRHRLLAGLTLALSNFMVVLDLTIANVSVPHIAGNLGISADQGTWVITSYAVAEAICVPLTGWLAQRFGAVRLFILGMVGFGLFSLLCGLSMSLGMLVVCRIGQGLCGGPLMPMSQTLLMRIYPPEQRGRVMGLWAMTTLLGPAMGPIIGGYISDNWSWHWIFFINLPIAVLCVFSALVLLRPVETERVKLPIDYVGLGLLIFWIGCLQIMLDIGRDHDWFGDPFIVALAVLAGLGFCVFLIWELTEEHPIVDLRVFRHIGFTSGVFTLALCFGAYFAGIVVIPQWLQMSMGYTAAWSGLATAMTAMTALFVAPVAGRLVSKVDVRIMISAGVSWIGLMTLWRAQWSMDADFWTIALPQFVQGFGMPFFMIPLTTLTLGSVRPEETASAAGMQNFLRTLAIAISTSIVLTGWSDGQRVSRNEMAGALNADPTMADLASRGFTQEQSRQVVSNLVDAQSLVVSMNHVFYAAAMVLFLAAALVWLAPRPTGKVDTSAAH